MRLHIFIFNAVLLFSQQLHALTFTLSLQHLAHIDIHVTIDEPLNPTVFSGFQVTSPHTIARYSFMVTSDNKIYCWKKLTYANGLVYTPATWIKPEHHLTLPEISTNPLTFEVPADLLVKLAQGNSLHITIRQRLYIYDQTHKKLIHMGGKTLKSTKLHPEALIGIHGSGTIAPENIDSVPEELRALYTTICSSVGIVI